MSDNALNKIPANRRLIDELYVHERISIEAKEYALDFLYPVDKWSAWVSRLLLIIGTTLILCGIIYFFAFNWAKITPLVKLSSIQIGMVGCLIGAYFYSLERISGQILLLSASVLAGVFMAVFGQIYQTGADAYQLFMVWSLVIFGWTIISNFAPLWVLWLAVTNLFLFLWWEQSALPDQNAEQLIYTYLTILNGSALILREHFFKKMDWLQAKWIGIVLILAVLLSMLIPITSWISKPSRVTYSIIIGGALGIIGHGALYILYRYKLKDMWSLAAVSLSFCIIAEFAGVKILSEVFNHQGFFIFILIGGMTLAIFTAAVIYLRRVIDIFEVNNV